MKAYVCSVNYTVLLFHEVYVDMSKFLLSIKATGLG